MLSIHQELLIKEMRYLIKRDLKGLAKGRFIVTLEETNTDGWDIELHYFKNRQTMDGESHNDLMHQVE